MTYNIHHGAPAAGGLDLEAIADVIRAHEVDVVGLQEVDRHWSQRSDCADQVAQLAESLAMYHFFAPIYELPGEAAGRPRREYGLAVLSRFPIAAATNHVLTRLPTVAGDSVRRVMPGFPAVTLDVGGTPLHLFNTHLDYRGDPALRVLQVQETLEIVERLPGPKVLLGDLNAEPQAPELLPLKRVFRDAWEIRGIGAGHTYPASAPVKRIDYILVTPDVQVAAVVVPETAASDHRPVIADLQLPRQEPAAGDVIQRVEGWVERQLSTLSLEQKVAQLFSVWAGGTFQSADHPSYRQLVDLVERFGVGGLIFGVGEPMEQAALINDLQRRARLPLLVSQDMEWGAGMRLARATTLPRAMALGATRQPEYAYYAGYITGVEARALGVHQILAPVADVNNNPLNPVINTRSFGERPDLVAEMTAAFVRGAQTAGVIATVKHFPGHGDTDADSHLSLPVLRIGRPRLDSLELVPFRAALDAGVASVMTGHLALPALEPDTTVPATLSPRITQRILREELGFGGLVVTDAMTMRGVSAHFDPGEAAVRAIEAGVDLMLKSADYDAALAAVVAAVHDGRLTRERIDASVRRILRAKADLGLMQEERRYVDLGTLRKQVASSRHLALAGAMTRASLTLLRNEGGMLPLTPPATPRVLVVTLDDGGDPAGSAPFAQAVRRAATTGTFEFTRLDARADSSAYAAVLERARGFDLVLISAFVRVRSGSGRIRMEDAQAGFLNELIAGGRPVALVSFGNPYMAAGLRSQPNAYLVAYGSDAAAQEAAAQAVFGRAGTPGRLPVTIPGAYTYGAGIPSEQTAPRVDFPEAAGIEPAQITRVDSLLRARISARELYGAAVAVGRGGTIALLSGRGYPTFTPERPLNGRSTFDVSSLAPVLVTRTAAAQLYEAQRLDLDAPAALYLPELVGQESGAVTVRRLLARPPGVSDLLARIVERVTGQDLASYAAENIFRPLGMQRTTMQLGREDYRGVAALDSVELLEGVAYLPRVNRRDQHAAAEDFSGFVSTAEDLATFAYMLLNEGEIYGRSFLRQETLTLFAILEAARASGCQERTGGPGTFLWIDPEQQLFAVVLVQRVSGGGVEEQHALCTLYDEIADLARQSAVVRPASRPEHSVTLFSY